MHVEVCEMVELTAWGPLHRCGPQMHVRLRLTQTVSVEVDSLQQPTYVQVCGVWCVCVWCVCVCVCGVCVHALHHMCKREVGGGNK